VKKHKILRVRSSNDRQRFGPNFTRTLD